MSTCQDWAWALKTEGMAKINVSRAVEKISAFLKSQAHEEHKEWLSALTVQGYFEDQMNLKKKKRNKVSHQKEDNRVII